MVGSDSDVTKIGPFGKNGGYSWDGKGQGNIVQIFVCHNTLIRSFQYQYVDNGKLMLSELHGHTNANKFDAVVLAYPKEYITGIRGYFNSNSGEGIRSITFTTNLGEHGPFGGLPNLSATDKEFSVKFGEINQFFGFCGTTDRSYGSLCSIGFYMKPKADLDLVKNERVN